MRKNFLLAALLPLLSFAQERIMVIADPHVLPQSVIAADPDFDSKTATEIKMLHLSEPIWHALLDTALKYKPELVLIPGDLTRNGEPAAHDTVSAGLKRLEAAGIRTLVIPGNHDFPQKYDWDALYAGTYVDAVRDANSRSYAVSPLKNVTVIAFEGENGMDNIKPATLQFVMDQADEAKAKNNTIIAMTHWQILEHFDSQGDAESASRYLEADALRDSLMMHGVHLVLTGHFHVNSITTWRDSTGIIPDSLVELSTGSLITFPCPYRWLTISEDRSSIDVSTDFIAAVDTVADLESYSRVWAHDHTQSLLPVLAVRLWGKVWNRWDEKIVPALQEAGISSTIISMIKMMLPQDQESQIKITQKHLAEPVADLYVFHSEANENERPEEGQAIADAIYDGMTGMLGELFGPFVTYVPQFKDMMRSMAEGAVQSIVEDKTQRDSELYYDITDDLRPTLVINQALPTGIEAVETESGAIKFLLNGQLFIQKGDRIYTSQGQQIAQ